jgi:cytochrome c biogenesis protein CcmG, thiol:disulfide interchange protein DsbE
MVALSRGQWNVLLAGVLLVGSIFIQVTRVRPTQGLSTAISSVDIAPNPAPQANHPAPDFGLSSLDGSTVRLSDLKGQVALINVWATWCPPCRAEMPTIQAAYEQYADQGFTVLAVNLREDPRAVAAFMRQYGLTFPALLDLDGKVSVDYRATVLPSSFFVDRRGVIRAVYRGPMPRSIIAGTVAQLLQEGS